MKRKRDGSMDGAGGLRKMMMKQSRENKLAKKASRVIPMERGEVANSDERNICACGDYLLSDSEEEIYCFFDGISIAYGNASDIAFLTNAEVNSSLIHRDSVADSYEDDDDDDEDDCRDEHERDVGAFATHNSDTSMWRQKNTSFANSVPSSSSSSMSEGLAATQDEMIWWCDPISKCCPHEAIPGSAENHDSILDETQQSFDRTFDYHDGTFASPEKEYASLYGLYASPEKSFLSPGGGFASPCGTYVSRESSFMSPQGTFMSFKRTCVAPEGTCISHDETFSSVENMNVSPESTFISPERSFISPGTTLNYPKTAFVHPEGAILSHEKMHTPPAELCMLPDRRRLLQGSDQCFHGEDPREGREQDGEDPREGREQDAESQELPKFAFLLLQHALFHPATTRQEWTTQGDCMIPKFLCASTVQHARTHPAVYGHDSEEVLLKAVVDSARTHCCRALHHWTDLPYYGMEEERMKEMKSLRITETASRAPLLDGQMTEVEERDNNDVDVQDEGMHQSGDDNTAGEGNDTEKEREKNGDEEGLREKEEKKAEDLAGKHKRESVDIKYNTEEYDARAE